MTLVVAIEDAALSGKISAAGGGVGADKPCLKAREVARGRGKRAMCSPAHPTSLILVSLLAFRQFNNLFPLMSTVSPAQRTMTSRYAMTLLPLSLC
jgi:hypothetical protein